MGRAKRHQATAFTSFLDLLRARADGRKAVVCALLPGRPPTRWVAPKGIRVSGVLSLRHFGLVLLSAWCRTIWRGEHGFGGRDAARPVQAAWAVQRLLAARWRGRRRRRRRFLFSFDLLISAH